MNLRPRLKFALAPAARAPAPRFALRRAPRSLVAAGVAFVLATVGLNAALETVRPEWRDPEFGWRLKAVQQIERTRGGRPLVLAFGNSRTQMGFSPRDLGGTEGPRSPVVYNFGLSGSGPLQFLLNLRRVLDAGVRPAAILVEAMPSALAIPGMADDFYRDKLTRLSHADLGRLEPYAADPAALRNRWLAHRLLPWHTQRFLLMSHWEAGFLPWQARVDFQWRLMDSRGWSPYPFDAVSAADRARQSAQAQGEYEQTLRRFALAPLPDRALRDILTLCRDRGIATALYRMPEGSAFRAWTAPETAATIAAYLREVSGEFGAPVFDASTWLPDDAFADGHHALKSGAKQFSERFGRECLNPWLRSCKLMVD